MTNYAQLRLSMFLHFHVSSTNLVLFGLPAMLFGFSEHMLQLSHSTSIIIIVQIPLKLIPYENNFNLELPNQICFYAWQIFEFLDWTVNEIQNAGN